MCILEKLIITTWGAIWWIFKKRLGCHKSEELIDLGSKQQDRIVDIWNRTAYSFKYW